VEQACERLIVLGVGRVLLHDSVAQALASHRIVADGASSGDGTPIATFAGPLGERLTLVRHAPSSVTAATDPRHASLEEVVLGYLASGRALPGEAAA
jgi:hypothetical protein